MSNPYQPQQSNPGQVPRAAARTADGSTDGPADAGATHARSIRPPL